MSVLKFISTLYDDKPKRRNQNDDKKLDLTPKYRTPLELVAEYYGATSDATKVASKSIANPVTNGYGNAPKPKYWDAQGNIHTAYTGKTATRNDIGENLKIEEKIKSDNELKAFGDLATLAGRIVMEPLDWGMSALEYAKGDIGEGELALSLLPLLSAGLLKGVSKIGKASLSLDDVVDITAPTLRPLERELPVLHLDSEVLKGIGLPEKISNLAEFSTQNVLNQRQKYKGAKLDVNNLGEHYGSEYLTSVIQKNQGAIENFDLATLRAAKNAQPLTLEQQADWVRLFADIRRQDPNFLEAQKLSNTGKINNIGLTPKMEIDEQWFRENLFDEKGEKTNLPTGKPAGGVYEALKHRIAFPQKYDDVSVLTHEMEHSIDFNPENSFSYADAMKYGDEVTKQTIGYLWGNTKLGKSHWANQIKDYLNDEPYLLRPTEIRAREAQLRSYFPKPYDALEDMTNVFRPKLDNDDSIMKGIPDVSKFLDNEQLQKLEKYLQDLNYLPKDNSIMSKISLNTVFKRALTFGAMGGFLSPALLEAIKERDTK